MEAQKTEADGRRPATHYKPFNETDFFVVGEILFNAGGSGVEFPVEMLLHILHGVEKKYPWYSSNRYPQVQGIRIKEAKKSGGCYMIRCAPAEPVLKHSQLPAYSSYLKTLVDELATIDIPGVRSVSLTMRIETPTSTYDTPGRLRDLDARHPRITSETEAAA